ncbi:hypothetical protein [Actinomadura monticuli]|uniref:Uncharacterized protein n=1 Tax=Actinomadura monticuli TaxID=3097367 RepID=A0ABV4Q7V7_9ACTN
MRTPARACNSKRDLSFSGFGFGAALFGAAADLGDLPPDPDGAFVQVDIGPPQPARLAPSQPAEGDEVVEHVQPVAGGAVKEGAGLFGCPDQRFGSAAGGQFDQGGDVEVDAPFPDRLVEGGAQGGADPVHGRRADHPGPFTCARSPGLPDWRARMIASLRSSMASNTTCTSATRRRSRRMWPITGSRCMVIWVR